MSKRQKFEVDDFVWAKMKGYPPWPGKIIGAKKRSFYIFFFGSENYAWIQQKHLYPYEEFANEFSSKVKSPSLKKAITDIAKCFQKTETSSDESDEDIPLSQLVSSSSEEDLPLISLANNASLLSEKLSNNPNSNEKQYVLVNGELKLARTKYTKGSLNDSKDYTNIISVSVNDKASINKIIPRKLTVNLSRYEMVT